MDSPQVKGLRLRRAGLTPPNLELESRLRNTYSSTRH